MLFFINFSLIIDTIFTENFWFHGSFMTNIRKKVEYLPYFLYDFFNIITKKKISKLNCNVNSDNKIDIIN